MDDTIFDHTGTCRAAIREVQRRYRTFRTLPTDDLLREYAHLLHETHIEVLRGRLTPAEARAARWTEMLARHGGGHRAPGGRGIAVAYRRAYEARRRAVPGAVPLLRRLHGRTTIGVVTNNTVEEQEEKLRYLGLEGTVDHLVTAAEVGSIKPSPRIFRTALRRAGAQPDEAVMIGNSWVDDVRGALDVGIRPIWLNRFGLPRPERVAVAETPSLRPIRPVLDLIVGATAHGAARIISRPPMQTR
jgi:HAD superfamily hydrolase (TIGR01549 family)